RSGRTDWPSAELLQPRLQGDDRHVRPPVAPVYPDRQGAGTPARWDVASDTSGNGDRLCRSGAPDPHFQAPDRRDTRLLGEATRPLVKIAHRVLQPDTAFA